MNDEVLLDLGIKYLSTINKRTNRNFKVLSTTSFDEGLLVHYQTANFVDNGELKHAILGSTWFIVSRLDGLIFHDLKTNIHDKESYINHFILSLDTPPND